MLISSKQLFDEVVILGQRAKVLKSNVHKVEYRNSSEAIELTRKFDQFIGHMMDKKESSEIMIAGVQSLLQEHKIDIISNNKYPRFEEFVKKHAELFLKI